MKTADAHLGIGRFLMKRIEEPAADWA